MRVEGGGATLAFTSETPIIVKRLCSRYFAPPFSIPFPLAPYIHPLPRSRLPSPSRASASLTDSPGPSIPSKWIPIHRDATKMVKHEHSLLPYRFGERDLNVLLRNWRRLGVGMEGRNCRQPSACLPASSTTLLHPIPSPYPTFYIPEALIQTRFVNIDVRSALRSCKFSLPFLSLSHAIPLDLRFCSNLLLPPRSKVGQWPSSRKPKLVGWLFLFNADYGRSLVAGILSGDKFVRLSFERILSNPASTDTSCYHPFSGGERSHDKFQRSR